MARRSTAGRGDGGAANALRSDRAGFAQERLEGPVSLAMTAHDGRSAAPHSRTGGGDRVRPTERVDPGLRVEEHRAASLREPERERGREPPRVADGR